MVSEPVTATGQYRILVCKALLGGPELGLTRQAFLSINNTDRHALDNALHFLKNRNALNRDDTGVWSIKDRKAVERFAGQKLSVPSRKLIEDRKIDARNESLDPLRDPRAPTERGLDRFENRVPAIESESERNMLFGLNEDGDVEVSRRDGEGAVVVLSSDQLSTVMALDQAELDRLTKFEKMTRETRRRLARSRETEAA